MFQLSATQATKHQTIHCYPKSWPQVVIQSSFPNHGLKPILQLLIQSSFQNHGIDPILQLFIQHPFQSHELKLFEAWNPSSPYISSMILCSLRYRGTLSIQLAATRNDSLALALPHPGEQASSSPCSTQKVSCSPSSAAAAAPYHHLFDHHCLLLMLLQDASVLLQGAS